MARVNYLLYTNDHKILEATGKQSQQMLRMVKEFFNDINMKCGLNKCPTINIVREKLQEGKFEIPNIKNIAAIEAEET